jgi:hypothetical protein
VTDWEKDPKGNTKLIAKTFREAGKIAGDAGLLACFEMRRL